MKKSTPEVPTVREAKVGTSIVTIREDLQIGDSYDGGWVAKKDVLKKPASGSPGIFEYRIRYGITKDQLTRSLQTAI